MKSHGDLLSIVGNIKPQDILHCQSFSLCETISAVPVRLSEEFYSISLNLSMLNKGEIILRIERNKVNGGYVALSVSQSESVKVTKSDHWSISLPFVDSANVMHVQLSSLQPYFMTEQLFIKPRDGICDRNDHVFARLWIPWSNDELYYKYTCLEEDFLLFSATPNRNEKISRKPVLSIFKTTDKDYDIIISPNIRHTIGSYFRFNSMSLIVYGFLSLWIMLLCSMLEELNWFNLLASCSFAAALKILMTLFIFLTLDFEDVKYTYDPGLMNHLGVWAVVVLPINFLISTSGLVMINSLFHMLFKLTRLMILFGIRIITISNKITSIGYALWSVVFITSPIISPCLPHMLCLMWLIKRSKCSGFSVLHPETLTMTIRMFLFGLTLPNLITFVKNLIETNFNMHYLLTEVVTNANSESTCFGLLMWTVLHLNPIELPQFSSSTLKGLIFTIFPFFLMLTDNSFSKCLIFDLIVWLFSGAFSLINACFQPRKKID